MNRKEQFLREYKDQVLDNLTLPDGLNAQYVPVSCLKDGERKVYLVRDQAGWPAILKIQPTGREDALRQEYELLRQLNHPQIPRPLSYLEFQNREYLVREYVEGVSLYERVNSQGPLSPEQAKAAVISLCQVLEYLHSQTPPVICRDVKPQNVVIDASGCCHLIDLGAARRYRAEQRGDTVFLGTEATAPPEQFGYQQTDCRSDVYSLGMLLRFLLSGSFDPLPAMPGAGFLVRVARRCTAFDPKNRYSTARAVLRALKYRGLCLTAGAAVGVLCAGFLFALLWNFSPYRNSSRYTRTSSSLLEEALCQELRLEDGEPIPLARLGEVEQLLVCGQKLMGTLREHEEFSNTAHDCYAVETAHGDISNQDLELLERCVNLKVLVLDYQQITDLSSLADLPLEYLSLRGNEVSDLAPLSGLTELRVLDLGENPVRSADVLSGLSQLREITLEATGITSVETLAGSGIQSLNVRSTWVSDFSPLENCPHLTRLIVGELPSGAAETLEGLTGLEELRLYSTPDVDLRFLIDLKTLRDMDLYGCTILYPDVLMEFPVLQRINLGETGWSDLSLFSTIPSLTELDLRENPLSDLSPLRECPWLSRLILSPRHRPLAEEQLSGVQFEIEYQ